MVMARWQATIVDDEGNVQDGASIEVRREVSGSPLASLFSDRDGTVPLGNPFLADSDGFAAFHVAGGAYRITATKGGFSRVWRYVAVGTAQELDEEDLVTPVGGSETGQIVEYVDTSGRVVRAATKEGSPETPLLSADLVCGPAAATVAGQIAIYADESGRQLAGADEEGSPSSPLTIAELLDLIAASGGGGGAAVPSVNGLIIVNNSGTPTTSIDIDADDAVLLNSSGNAVRTGAVNLTVAAAGTGANGLDAGSLANNTWYYAYIIYNPSTETVAGLLSASATSPTMPSGYTFRYRVGAIRTGGSATFIRMRQVGNRAQYVVVSGSVTPNLPIMISGTSGNPATPTWTAVATGNYVPTTARIIDLVVGTGNDATNVIVAPNNNYGNFSSATNPPPVASARGNGFDSGYVTNIPLSLVLETTNIYYAASGEATPFIACRGWIDAVNAS